MTALSSVRKKTSITVCKSHLNAIKAALAAYETDMGRYPRLSAIPIAPPAAGSLGSDAPALYAALRNLPGRGGGPNSPYLQDWKIENVGILGTGHVTGGVINHADMALSGDWVMNTQTLDALSDVDRDDMNTMLFQGTHNPGTGGSPLVLLDPWGGVYHYREWASVRKSVKHTMSGLTSAVSEYSDGSMNPGDPVIIGTKPERARSPESFDIWSNGPNGVNEFGHPDSDDVTSWR